MIILTAKEIYNQMEYLETKWRLCQSKDFEYLNKLAQEAEEFANKQFTEVEV